MYYNEYKPCSQLEPLVACYWILQLDAKALISPKEIVLPDGCVELLINTGPPFQRYDLLSGDQSTVDQYALVGQRKSAIEIYPQLSISLFAIRFKSYALPFLLPINSSEVTGKLFLDRKVRDRIVNPLRKYLENPKLAIQEKLEAMENCLLRGLNNSKTIKPYLQKAVDDIVKNKGNFNVQRFCEHHGIHKSTLQKTFLFEVGISPKEYAAIIRFNHAYALLKGNAVNSYVQAALEGGYYDQSHMIKDFKRYSGSTPSSFLKADYSLPDITLEFTRSIQNCFPAG